MPASLQEAQRPSPIDWAAMASEKDRFDKLPHTRGRVGAHRGTRTRGLGWIWVLVALLVAAVLVFGTLRVLATLMDREFPWLGVPTTSPTATETAAPPEITDPADIDPARGISIIVLNGTPEAGLQDDVYQQLADAGWPVTSKGNAGSREQLDTVIFYSNPADIDVARGLVDALGVGEIQGVGPEQYPGASITIVIGEDSPLYPQADGAATNAGAAGP